MSTRISVIEIVNTPEGKQVAFWNPKKKERITRSVGDRFRFKVGDQLRATPMGDGTAVLQLIARERANVVGLGLGLGLQTVRRRFAGAVSSLNLSPTQQLPKVKRARAGSGVRLSGSEGTRIAWETSIQTL